MIVDPLPLADSVPVTHNFARVSINGQTSEWFDPASTPTVRWTGKVAHRKSGKGGVTKSSLMSLKVSVKNVTTGIWEDGTLNITYTGPVAPVTLVDADIDKLLKMGGNFLTLGSDPLNRFRRMEP